MREGSARDQRPHPPFAEAKGTFSRKREKVMRCPADTWVTKWTGYMGDTRSRSGSLRRFTVPARGNGEAAQFLLVPIDPADRQIEEADQPMTGLGLLHRDSLAGKGAADVDELALPLDLSVRPH